MLRLKQRVCYKFENTLIVIKMIPKVDLVIGEMGLHFHMM